MACDLSLINTPETLGVTPRFVLQHNAVSRSANNLSATARKLTAMAMALLPCDLSGLTASFTFVDFCKAMNMPLGGKTYKVFKAAVNECMKCVITVETEPDEKGRKKWKQFTWFSETEFDEVTGKAVMTFSKKLADHLRALKWVYTKINLKDVGGLQSRYAIRIFEIIMSTAFLKGRQGNLNGQWYFQASVSDFRFILGVPADAYKQTHIMRRYVFDNPIKEINEAGIGIKLSYEGIKQGKNIVAIRITAEFSARKAQIKGKGVEETLALSTITLKTEDQRSEKELEHLKELYPEEFAALYKEAMSKHPFMPKDSEVLKLAAEGSALMKLREKYGIRK